MQCFPIICNSRLIITDVSEKGTALKTALQQKNTGSSDGNAKLPLHVLLCSPASSFNQLCQSFQSNVLFCGTTSVSLLLNTHSHCAKWVICSKPLQLIQHIIYLILNCLFFFVLCLFVSVFPKYVSNTNIARTYLNMFIGNVKSIIDDNSYKFTQWDGESGNSTRRNIWQIIVFFSCVLRLCFFAKCATQCLDS